MRVNKSEAEAQDDFIMCRRERKLRERRKEKHKAQNAKSKAQNTVRETKKMKERRGGCIWTISWSGLRKGFWI